MQPGWCKNIYEADSHIVVGGWATTRNRSVVAAQVVCRNGDHRLIGRVRVKSIKATARDEAVA